MTQTIPLPGPIATLFAASASGSTALNMVLATTLVSLLPGILLATTSFVRIAVVLTFLRNALGTQNMPPTQVLMGLSLFATFGIMAPVIQKLYTEGVQPYMENRVDFFEATEKVASPLRHFMIKQTRGQDLALFYNLAKKSRPKNIDDIFLHLLIPAFMISELKTAFEMGFVLYLPFLLIDVVTATLLMSLGMNMVPPMMIGLPLKIMLFVLSDGWNVLISSLVRSFL